MNKFISIGTNKLAIGLCQKMAYTTISEALLSSKMKGIFKYEYSFKNDKIYVVLIRDVIDKWRSGYLQELDNLSPLNLWSHMGLPRSSIPSEQPIGYRFNFLIKNTRDLRVWVEPDMSDSKREGLDIEKFCEIHDVNNDLSWMWSKHAQFWKWNHFTLHSLSHMSKFENIYFLELDDLSNPKFLKWLQEKDEKWKAVEEIPRYGKHTNSGNGPLSKFLDSFFKEYQAGNILQDKKLVSPFYGDHSLFERHLYNNLHIEKFDIRDNISNDFDPDFDYFSRARGLNELDSKNLKGLCKLMQKNVDMIRKKHSRYLNFRYNSFKD
jgi:hypothetical protein